MPCNPAPGRRFVVRVKARKVYRLRAITQQINEWLSRRYLLAGLELGRTPSPRGDLVATLVYEFPPSLSCTPLWEVSDTVVFPNDLRAGEDVSVDEWPLATRPTRVRSDILATV